MNKLKSAYGAAAMPIKSHIASAKSRKMAPPVPKMSITKITTKPSRKPSQTAAQAAPRLVAPAARRPSKPQQALKPEAVFKAFGVTMAPSAAARAPSPDTQARDEHQAMLDILGKRLLQIKAAKAAATSTGTVDAAIENIARTDDLALAVDFFPVLTEIISQPRDAPSTSSTMGVPEWPPSLAACVALLPVIEKLVMSQYESYNIAALEFIAAVLRRWSPELKAGASMQGSLSSQGFSVALLGMQTRIGDRTKSKLPELRAAAEVVDALLSAL